MIFLNHGITPIVSIHKREDPSDYNNYLVISLINNVLKIVAKIISNKINGNVHLKII